MTEFPVVGFGPKGGPVEISSNPGPATPSRSRSAQLHDFDAPPKSLVNRLDAAPSSYRVPSVHSSTFFQNSKQTSVPRKQPANQPWNLRTQFSVTTKIPSLYPSPSSNVRRPEGWPLGRTGPGMVGSTCLGCIVREKYATLRISQPQH